MDVELYDNAVSYDSKPNHIFEQAVLSHNTAICSAPAQHMMQTMGWQHGQGLGKVNDGRTQPVETQPRKRRAGLGLPFAVDRPTVNTVFLKNTLKQQEHATKREIRNNKKPKR